LPAEHASATAQTSAEFSFHDIFRKLRRLAENGPEAWDIQGDGDVKGKFRLLVANTPELRERAFRLGARVYKKMGYLPETSPDLLCSRFDARPDTFILLVVGEDGRDAATLTLVFDSEEDGLPLDDIYQPEADVLRAKGRRLAEFVRLAVDDSIRGHQEILVHMFNFCHVYAFHVMNLDDFLITVNPRHVAYYRRLLGFEVGGVEKLCPKVQNAPALLLRLTREYVETQVHLTAGSYQRERNHRSLYPFFYAQEVEPFIAAFLKHRHKPMTAAEAERLGLAVHA
jgi:hypothetical protein